MVGKKPKIPYESLLVSGLMNVIDLVAQAKLTKYKIETEDGWNAEVWYHGDSK